MIKTNRWYMLSEDERDEVFKIKYGWMLVNILKYGNCLIPQAAINKSSLRMIKAALEQDLSDLGFQATIDIKKYYSKEYHETDYIAEGTFDDNIRIQGKAFKGKTTTGRIRQ